jgi:serine/threonine-protein kinase
VVKEISFALVPDIAALDRFEREANLLGELSHPRIPRLVRSFREGEGSDTRL